MHSQLAAFVRMRASAAFSTHKKWAPHAERHTPHVGCCCMRRSIQQASRLLLHPACPLACPLRTNDRCTHTLRRRYVVLLPSGMLPLARQYVAALLSEARARRLAVLVAGRGVLPSGSTAKQRGWRGGGAPPVLLVDRSGYYPALIEVGARERSRQAGHTYGRGGMLPRRGMGACP